MSESDADKTFRTKSLVDRRDFVNGVAMTIGASLFPFRELLGQESSPDSSAQEYFLSKGITPQDPRYYPPALTGMRGSHPGSFEAAHGLRDGKASHDVIDTEEDYDMVVVGGGISGLASAYFYRKSAGPQARILILEPAATRLWRHAIHRSARPLQQGIDWPAEGVGHRHSAILQILRPETLPLDAPEVCNFF